MKKMIISVGICAFLCSLSFNYLYCAEKSISEKELSDLIENRKSYEKLEKIRKEKERDWEGKRLYGNKWPKEKADEDARMERIEKEYTKKRDNYISNHPKLPELFKQSILRNEVMVGMTKEDVLISIESPYKTNKTITQNGTREQWVYNGRHRGNAKIEFVYFDNGIVSAIQTH